jgi:hypothetical protein
MLIVELSDHPGEMLRDVHRQRAEAQERGRSRHDQAQAQHRQRIQDARDRRDQARAQHRWWTWLLGVFALRRVQRDAPRPPVSDRTFTDREQILAAGMTGEHIVAAELGDALGDDWTLLRGYKNRRGEIDHILLGPSGLVAVEVKHRNGRVHCDGDRWWYDKYDRYGNLVEQGQQISDRRGRSPSVQLNEPANELERFLSSRGHPVAVDRVVLLTHPRSQLGSCRNLTVGVATSTEWIIDRLNDPRASSYTRRELIQLKDLIVRDHRFHAAKRPAR